jgi:phosphate transport system protein
MGQASQEQLADAIAAITRQDASTAEAVVQREDVRDGQRGLLEEECFELLQTTTAVVPARRALSAPRVVYNLERIGDAACNIAKHSLMLQEEGTPILPVGITDLAAIARKGLHEGVSAFVNNDTDLVARPASASMTPSTCGFEELANMVDNGEIDGHLLLHTCAILRYLEKTCDHILNIGETTFFALTGARLAYAQFIKLQGLSPARRRKRRLLAPLLGRH